MPTKPIVFLAIPGESLPGRVAPSMRRLLDDAPIAGRVIDALVFPHQSRHVVTSRAVLRALSRIPRPGNDLVVVGFDFTLEARHALAQAGAILFFDHEYGWTDETWYAIR
jgi:hypothetical protein